MHYTLTKKTGLAVKVLALLLFLAFPGSAIAQLSVTTGVPTATLISSLIGQGMTVSNVVLNCPTNAYGTFSNGNTTNMGISNGILLTTGDAQQAIGPNNSASAGFCNNTSASDPDLILVEPQATLDPCILEFDVVPECNTLTINFVFGSEEYPEFVNAGYNDAFGFWITGAGPACQPNYYNHTNVATLPNNSTLVSIDNVNSGLNAAYYVDNTGGTTIQYDGFTTVLTRNILLCPCQTYHWKIAIADAGDCIYDSGVFIDFLSCSTALSATAASTPSSCLGCTGTATASATGQGPFTYTWSPSGGNAATATNLCPGTYTCTVDDAITCSPPTTVAVTVTSAATPITTASTQTDVSCFGACNGSANVNVTGGNGPFTYLWAPSGGNGSTALGLCPGTYTCTVTGAGGCTTSPSFTITEPPAITQNLSSVPSTCNASDGSATTVANGGTGPYTYNWQPGNGNAATYANIPSGQYTITVTDANNCTSIDSVVVTNTVNFSVTSGPIGNVTCNAACDGSLSATASSGSPPFTYAWAPAGGNASAATNLCAGTYTCTITDATGCLTTVSFTVTEPGPLTVVTPTPPPVICTGGSTTLSAAAAGGTGPYVYAWQPGNLAGSSPAVSPAATTTYTVTVTDANGCTVTGTELITVSPSPVVALSGLPLSGCVPLHVVFSDLSTVTAPATITSWLWNFGDNSPTSTSQNPVHDYLVAGNYNVTLTVTSSAGCISTITLNNYISVFPGPTAGFSASPQPASVIESTITFTDQSSGATTWQWNFGDVGNSSSTMQNPSFLYPDTGCYLVQQVVTSANLCTDTAEAFVCIDPDWSIYFPNAFTPNDDGVNDFFIPLGTGIDEDNYQLWIFDRWGNLIFTTTDFYKGWNGKVEGGKEICQIDTYVWRVKCKDVMGNNHKYYGKVSIIK
jgi:gliding motility-associated-like protein